MRILLIFLSVLWLSSIKTSAQANLQNLINQKVAAIDSNKQLLQKTFEAKEIYYQTSDGGGFLTITHLENKCYKIEQEIGLSYGRVTQIVYLENDVPIKILEKEENFTWIENTSSWDYSTLNTVYKSEVYILDWAQNTAEFVEVGKRVFTSESYDLTAYEPLLELSTELMNEQY